MKKTKKIISLIIALLSIFSSFSVNIFAAEKTEVKTIKLSDYNNVVYYNEAVSKTPSLTASSSVPYKPSPVYVKLFKKDSDVWKEFSTNSIVREGTYHWEIQVRIDGDNAKKYKFSNSPTVYVDGKRWSAGDVNNASSYSTAIIISPEFKITQSSVRPSDTKIKTVSLTVPTYHNEDKIPSDYGNIILEGTGSKFSTVSSPKVYCKDIQSGPLSKDTLFKTGNTYKIKIYVAPKDGYEFSDSTTVKINGKKIDSSLITLAKNKNGVTELCVTYSFVISGEETEPSIFQRIAGLFLSAFNFLKSLFSFLK